MSKSLNFAMSAQRVCKELKVTLYLCLSPYFILWKIIDPVSGEGIKLKSYIQCKHFSLQISFVDFNYSELVSAMFMKLI